MLKIIRKVGQEIYIDKGKIKIILLSQKDDLISIGIQAPKYIEIDRKEIFIRKRVEQHKLAQEKRKITTE